MSHRPPRREGAYQPPREYAAVPQSPGTGVRQQQNVPRRQGANRPPTANGPRRMPQPGRGVLTSGVARGAVGAGYGPYSYQPNSARDAGVYNNSRFSVLPSEASHSSGHNHEKGQQQQQHHPPPPPPPPPTMPPFLYDKDADVDDPLHNPDPHRDARLDRSCDPFSFRGWMNAGMIVLILFGLLTLFAGYPIIIEVSKIRPPDMGWNLGGINSTGQIPDFPNMPTLIDSDTPSWAYTRTGSDGKKYNLVFSDEFERDGRTFWPGDDPFWEAANLHYWPTGDIQYYDPNAITTANGKLVITIRQKRTHELNFESGMLTSWNKVCFMTGYIEVAISMPGTPRAPGLWPGAWTLGNLGRAGYGATTEGMWPYSYDTCDVGTFPNQTRKDDTPVVVATGGEGGGSLSWLPGQRVSACTCPGSDHPGPSVNVGRGVPEIDIIETQIDTDRFQGQVSQSLQIAPFNLHYGIDQSGTDVFDDNVTQLNYYTGGHYQQAVSAVTYIDSTNYNDTGYGVYGYEWWSNPRNRDEGYITWYSEGKPSWTVRPAAIGPDTGSEIGPRLIPEEPLYVIMNLGLSPSFQLQDWKHLEFPAQMFVDYVRIYQRDDVHEGVTCDPSTRPTSDYIERHKKAYMNPDLVKWVDDAGYEVPQNSQYDGC